MVILVRIYFKIIDIMTSERHPVCRAKAGGNRYEVILVRVVRGRARTGRDSAGTEKKGRDSGRML